MTVPGCDPPGLPVGFVGLWAALRATLDDAHCWTVNNVPWIFWLCIKAPVAISNLINFFFFLNVVRVLVLKLKSSVSPESMKYRSVQLKLSVGLSKWIFFKVQGDRG